MYKSRRHPNCKKALNLDLKLPAWTCWAGRGGWMPLTDAALRALKSRAKPYTVVDGRGLYVEVAPTGGVSWRYRYWLNGKQEKVTLGQYPYWTLARGPADARREGAHGGRGQVAGAGQTARETRGSRWRGHRGGIRPLLAQRGRGESEQGPSQRPALRREGHHPVAGGPGKQRAKSRRRRCSH